MTKRASLISVDREILIEEQKFSQQRDLLGWVHRAYAGSLETLGLNLIDPALDLSYFRFGAGWYLDVSALRPGAYWRHN